MISVIECIFYEFRFNRKIGGRKAFNKIHSKYTEI